MSNGGKRFTASMPAGGDPNKPGWRDDPERPGVQRYWTGSEWDASIQPRPKPEPAWKGARVIALGILIAAAAVFIFWRIQTPTEAECRNQQLDVYFGVRDSVERACR